MQLTRRLGLKEATALGIGAMVGAGIFVLSGVAAGLAGPAVIISFVIAAVLECLLGLCYAELASRFPRAGGAYAFVSETMGPLWGTIAGWCYWGAWLTASSFVSQGFGNYLHALIGAPPVISAALLLLILGGLNILGVKLSGLIQLIIVLLDISLILVFFFGGVSHINSQLFIPFAPHGFSGILSATLVGFLSMVGWDGIVAVGEEIKRPRRTIPLAIFTAILVVLTLYLGLLIVAVGIIPWNVLGASTVPISLVSQRFLGTVGPIFLDVVIIIALVATSNAFIFSISRTAFAMGRKGLLPDAIAFIHPRLDTPIWAIVLGTTLQIIITGLSSIGTAVSATGLLYLLSFIFSLLALFVARRNDKNRACDIFFVPFFPVIPAVALLICLVLVVVVGGSGLLAGGIWIALGILLFYLRRRSIKQVVWSEEVKEKEAVPYDV